MPDFLPSIVDYIRHLPLVVKYFALIFFVAIEYIVPLFPGDTIVLLAGFLTAQQALGFLELSVSVIFGSLLGSIVAYQLGSLLAKSQHKYAWVKALTASQQFSQFNIWYKKWGALFLLINRFIPGIRALFFVAAGAARLPLAKVVILGGISAILFNACLLMLGYWLGFNADKIVGFVYHYSAIAYVLMVASGVLVLIYFWRKKKRKK